MRERRRKEEKKIKTARVEGNAVFIHLIFPSFSFCDPSVVLAFSICSSILLFSPKVFDISSQIYGEKWFIVCIQCKQLLIRFIFISYGFWKNNNDTETVYTGVECHGYSLPDSSRRYNCILRTHLIIQWRFYYISTSNILMRFWVFQLFVACMSMNKRKPKWIQTAYPNNMP